MANILDRIRARRWLSEAQPEPLTAGDIDDALTRAVKPGEPPTLPPAPYRSGLWGRIPSGDPDRS